MNCGFGVLTLLRLLIFRLIGESDEAQLSFLKNWIRSHIQDAQNILQKPIILAEFGKTNKDPGYNVSTRNQLLTTVYSAIYSSAKGGGAAAGGLFWQLLTENMDSFRDGYEIVFSECPSTADVITRQSKQLIRIRKMYARLKNMERWKRARDNNGGQPSGGNWAFRQETLSATTIVVTKYIYTPCKCMVWSETAFD